MSPALQADFLQSEPLGNEGRRLSWVLRLSQGLKGSIDLVATTLCLLQGKPVGRLCREEEVGEIFYQVILQQIVQAKRKPKKKNDLFSLLYFKEGENEAREVG